MRRSIWTSLHQNATTNFNFSSSKFDDRFEFRLIKIRRPSLPEIAFFCLSELAIACLSALAIARPSELAIVRLSELTIAHLSVLAIARLPL
jgi:hypothetical protein